MMKGEATGLKVLLYGTTILVIVGIIGVAVFISRSNREDESRRIEHVELTRSMELDKKSRETPLNDLEREELRQLNERIAKREIERRAK